MTKEKILDTLQEVCNQWDEALINVKYEHSEFEWKMLELVANEIINCFGQAIDTIRGQLEEEEVEE